MFTRTMISWVVTMDCMTVSASYLQVGGRCIDVIRSNYKLLIHQLCLHTTSQETESDVDHYLVVMGHDCGHHGHTGHVSPPNIVTYTSTTQT